MADTITIKKTAAGLYTLVIPPLVSSITVYCIGAGGNGGFNSGNGGGGGGGETAGGSGGLGMVWISIAYEGKQTPAPMPIIDYALQLS